jgi:hypothetical protein
MNVCLLKRFYYYKSKSFVVILKGLVASVNKKKKISLCILRNEQNIWIYHEINFTKVQGFIIFVYCQFFCFVFMGHFTPLQVPQAETPYSNNKFFLIY